ncbi:MAG: carboxypeptidase regulatory-like domain-containing protein [bacterium]|nr:carboxypeptidase regulatory-like domain-containing protein [bacterium]
MPRKTQTLLFALVLIFASFGVTGVADVARADGGALAGRVETSASPLSTVRVYAYALADLSLRKEITDRSGVFLFHDLPAGLYKIVAFKRGFVPAVVMLSRASQDAVQFLEVQLNQPPAYSESAAASFWEIRESIPTDVLRDIELPVVPVFAVDDDSSSYDETVPSAGFQTQMRATTGVHEGVDVGEAQVSGAEFDVTGQVNDVRIDLKGGYTTLAGDTLDQRSPEGSTQALSLRVANSKRSTVGFSTTSSHLAGPADSIGDDDSVNLERHQLSWTQALGRRASSSLSAQYIEESNFYSQAHLTPEAIPGASRSFKLEGSYENQITDRSNFEAGVRYRERDTEYRTPDAHNLLPQETVELFGRAGWKVKPAVVVQYGLYSALRDGTVSLAPQGGVVLQLGENWQASTLASRRMSSEGELYRHADFRPAYYRDARGCSEAEEYCYELSFSRSSRDDRTIKVGAIHRKIGETQRLFFDSDFFDRFDSLYLVDGDRLPEVKVEVTHRISPNVLTRIESNLGAGGGGLMRTADDSFENEVRYLVTSVDTRFEETDTGLYFAFHRLEQELTPLAGAQVVGSEVALERLQVGVSQELGFLDRLASDLALHLDMELSRGGTSQELFDELRKRITGGLAVTF